jgi:hypothetical protein
MRPSPANALALAAALWLGGCTAVPADERGPLSTAQRMLAIDFGPQAAAKQSRAWQRVRGVVGAEAPRAGALPAPTTVLAAELRRASQARIAAATTAAGIARKPRPVPKDLRTDPAQWAAGIVDVLAALPAALRLEQRAMNEPNDRRHRTDPFDDRPEATLVQRLWRRLGL